MKPFSCKIADIPKIATAAPGRLVTFVCGPGESHDPEFAGRWGITYGRRSGRFGDFVRVKMADGTFETVHSFSCGIGIGAFLHAAGTPLPS